MAKKQVKLCQVCQPRQLSASLVTSFYQPQLGEIAVYHVILLLQYSITYNNTTEAVSSKYDSCLSHVPRIILHYIRCRRNKGIYRHSLLATVLGHAGAKLRHLDSRKTPYLNYNVNLISYLWAMNHVRKAYQTLDDSLSLTISYGRHTHCPPCR